MRKNPVRKQTAERRISAFLRIGMALLLFLLYIAAVALLTYLLRAHATIVFVALEVAAIAMAATSRATKTMVAWARRR